MHKKAKWQVIHIENIWRDEKCKGWLCRKANFTMSQIISQGLHKKPSKDKRKNKNEQQGESVGSRTLMLFTLRGKGCKK